ncbi:MAG: high-affinity iron transporter [Micromonosporaceae bacterium]
MSETGASGGTPDGDIPDGDTDTPDGETPVPARDGRIRRQRVIGAALVLVVAGAAGWFAVGHGRATAAAHHNIEITPTGCAPGWQPAAGSAQSFVIVNKSGRTGEIYLLDTNGGVVGEIEGLGPGVQRTMSVPLANGVYKWLCVMTDMPVRASGQGRVTGSTAPAVEAVLPVSEKDLAAPVAAYQAYVAPKLADLLRQVGTLRGAVQAGDVATARSDWLAAQSTWEQVGAAYGSFEDLGDAIGGLPHGLPGGVTDADFTGLHRIEFGLWHNEKPASLLPVVDKLAADVTELRGKLPQLTIDPNDLSLRAHEILEDALRDHLTGSTDQGSGAAFAETYADLQGTRVVFEELAALVTARRPELPAQARDQMNTLEVALLANRTDGRWLGLSAAPLANRQRVNGALGALLETLAAVPDLLEIRNASQATK